MKLRVSILLLFMCLIGKAQTDEINESEPVTIDKVKNMAIYPGCEEFKRNNRDLIMCFGEKLNNDFLKYLDITFLLDDDREIISAILEFHVDTKGEITAVTAKKGDEIIFSSAEYALKRVAEVLKEQGRKIIPTKIADGSDTTLIMNLPIMVRNPKYKNYN